MGAAYSSLTEAEKKYVKLHPVNAYYIAQAMEIATAETINCIFRRIRPPIPFYFGHPFHCNSATRSK